MAVLGEIGWYVDESAWAVTAKEGTFEEAFPNTFTNSIERSEKSWRKLAELARIYDLNEDQKVLKTALERLLGWDIAEIEFTAIQRAFRLLMVPDVSALPEWQQRLVRNLWPNYFYALPTELSARDLLEAVNNGTVDFINGDPAFEPWLVRETRVRCFVCPAIDDSWIQTINDAIRQLPPRQGRLIRYFYKNLGATLDEDIYEKTARHFKMKSETTHKHLSEAQDMLREELKRMKLAISPLAEIAEHWDKENTRRRSRQEIR